MRVSVNLSYALFVLFQWAICELINMHLAIDR